jgi:membrane protein DedA with SNARE-associated domain
LKRLAAKLAAWGPGGVFLLAFLDSAGVPVPATVDALLMLTAVASPATAYLTAAAAVAGSLLGSLVLFSLARKGGEMYLARHTESPRAKKFRAWFGRYGLVTVFIPKLLPIPLPTKVFVVSAGALGVQRGKFLAVVLAARIPRYVALAYLGSKLGEDSVPWLKQHVWHMMGVAAILFALLFLLVRWADGER